jgi:membrane-bound ClpP family serine protease
MEALQFLLDMSFWQIIILTIGIVFCIFEMFHPGFGAPGITGAILLLVGVFWSAHTVFERLILMVIILAILGIALTLVLHSATKGHLNKMLVLSETQNKDLGYTGTEDLEFFLGKEGKVISILRPSGIVDFDGIKLDVVSEGDFIQKSARVTVIKVEGRRIVVRELKV